MLPQHGYRLAYSPSKLVWRILDLGVGSILSKKSVNVTYQSKKRHFTHIIND